MSWSILFVDIINASYVCVPMSHTLAIFSILYSKLTLTVALVWLAQQFNTKESCQKVCAYHSWTVTCLPRFTTSFPWATLAKRLLTFDSGVQLIEGGTWKSDVESRTANWSHPLIFESVHCLIEDLNSPVTGSYCTWPLPRVNSLSSPVLSYIVPKLKIISSSSPWPSLSNLITIDFVGVEQASAIGWE